MLKKRITYTDYNGEERTEDFYFNLSKAEIIEMEMGVTGGLTELIKKVMATKDVPSVMKIFKDLILKAYGEKSADGKRFVKVNDAGIPLAHAFAETEAYSQLFMELATDADAAAKFVNGIVPKDTAMEAEKHMAANN